MSRKRLLSSAPDAESIDLTARTLLLGRRKFMVDTLVEHGQISEEAVRDWYLRWNAANPAKAEDYSEKAIALDIVDLRFLLSREIVQSTQDGKRIWVDRTSRLSTSREARQKLEIGRKSKLAEVVCSLILGGATRQASITLGSAPVNGEFGVPPLDDEVEVSQFESIADQLDEKSFTGLRAKLRRVLKRRSHLRIAIDAGTTNEVLCQEFLQRILFPISDICKIEVCTNSRHIFNVLGDSRVEIKTLVIGGRQQDSGQAISGLLAENWVRSSLLHFDLAIIGTTRVKMSGGERDLGCLGCATDHDASMKLLLMQVSKLKVIVADQTKFHPSAEYSYIPFCRIPSQHVDLVVTDEASDADHIRFKEWKTPLLVHR